MRNERRQVTAFTEIKFMQSRNLLQTTILSPENSPSIKVQINILYYFSEISMFYLLMDASPFCIPFQLQIFCKTLGQGCPAILCDSRCG